MELIDPVNSKFIQIWRGIAVLLVVYFHFVDRLPPEALNSSQPPTIMFYSGTLGVLIFFAISGFLITAAIKNSHNLAIFYSKRLSRVWPLFILSASFNSVLFSFIDAPVVFFGPKTFLNGEPEFADYIGNLFFLEDMGFRWLDGVYWSILVELKFYFLLGLLACIRPLDFDRWFTNFTIVFSCIEMIAENFLSGPFNTISTILNGIFVAQYLPFFAIGMLLYTGRHQQLLTIIITLCLLQAGLKIASNPSFEIYGTIMFGLILAMILLLDMILLNNRLFVLIGDYSYSWYLFHQMVGLTLIAGLVPAMGIDAAVAVALVATFMLAVLASWLAEWRYRHHFHSALMRLFSALRLDRLPIAGTDPRSDSSDSELLGNQSGTA